MFVCLYVCVFAVISKVVKAHVVQFHTLLSVAVDGGELSASRSGLLTLEEKAPLSSLPID
jgi:hypothetical protein